MKNITYLFAITLLIVSCTKKTNKDRAIDLVKSKYESSDQKLNFEAANLDSLYNISPKAYADSAKRGFELDSTLAVLESEIEHLPQQESDSVGLVSAALTKRRYQLLELAKTKPQFLGWKLSGVKIEGVKRETISFNFDKEITEIVE
ncbi:hypothetical protein [Pedobacter sp. Leaf250]|uniref:hypothetical protein n=1 Tax=Pedobacter sp. Leaf250 TaxID=2876559 RepID=UPI001E43778C|nr:hypothetical protein [Pedobacter sp. Leaf250]